MATSLVKDIYQMLCSKYPNRNIYVIGDQHFFHSNIINYTRSNFANVLEMNQYIIDKHNEVVNKDDIVIFLGDFCFKKDSIQDVVRQMNGHKYLILGNHDSLDLVKKYPVLGFEKVFTTPIKIGNIYLSHEPLMNDEVNDLQFKLITNEFLKHDSRTNYHGHIHSNDNDSLFPHQYKNATCEALAYKPLLIGKTLDYSNLNNPLFINTDAFNDVVTNIVDKHNVQPQLIISDYIYAMLLEALVPYQDSCFVQGSYGLLKKYNLFTKVSDLDMSFLYNHFLSRRENNIKFKEIIDQAFGSLMVIDNINLNFLKRYVSIRIFEAAYTSKHPYYTPCYLDANLIAFNCYKETDFINLSNHTIVQSYLQKNDPEIMNKYTLPQYNARFLSLEGDIANLVLQIIYQKDRDDKKIEALKRLKYICKYMTWEQDMSNLIDILSRFYLRNISFLYTTNRIDEISYIQSIQPDMTPFIKSLPSKTCEQLDKVLNHNDSNFTEIRRKISETPSSEVLNKALKLIKK